MIARMQAADDRVFRMAETDPELARLVPDPDVNEAARAPGLSYREIIATILASYADRPALKTRAYDLVTDPATGGRDRHVLPRYSTVTYGELAKQIEAMANFWRHVPGHEVQPGDIVAFLAFNGAEMTAVDLACIYANAIVVPLQANYPAWNLDEILADTAPVALVASIDNLPLATACALKHASVRSILVIAADERVAREASAIADARAILRGSPRPIALATFAEAVDLGGRLPFEPLPAPEGGRDRMVMIMYTSGSTGTPKGAIIHEAICVYAWTTPRSRAPLAAFVFAPMNHSLGRYTLYAALGQGGTAYLTQRSDLSTMLEDLRLARPTSLLMIPRICELAHQHYLAETGKRIAAGDDADTAHDKVSAEMRRTFLGDRLTSASVGSAPTTPELRQLIGDVFDIPIFDGYGNTESGGGGITVDNRISRAVTDFKLIDVPELGYYTTDQPYPRGELLVKTKNMIQGYYKQPEATAAIFDAEGFLKTGDVMERRGSDHLIWIDRRNNVMKLAQGEYVAIGPLETTYLDHGSLVDQIYLHGNAQRAFLLAVVVPAVDVARERLGREPTETELRRLVLDELREAAVKAELKPFEIPRDVLIELEPFSIHNGLLSAVGKPLRSNLKARYDEALEDVYRSMDRKLREERRRLRDPASGRSTLNRVTEAIKLDLGLADLDPASARTYTALGGDSLGAVNLALLLEESFEVSVPVTSILHPAATPTRLAEEIDRRRAGSTRFVDYEQIHPDPAEIRAEELSLDALLGTEALEAAKAASPPVDETRTVLITGANGFLGRFLCLEWLWAMKRVGGKVICLVRGSDEAAARSRIIEAIGEEDRDLASLFGELAHAHLEVIAADLSAPRLGLDEATFARLSRETDRIVHVAALVNHRLAYRNLFEPNVLGAAELVRLALTGRIKRFDYVSTVAVTHLSKAITGAPEKADVRQTVSRVSIAGDRYAVGYGASKWAGEVILRNASDRFGLPANVFRCDMILPHSRASGQINSTDSFTRLLASLILTGIAPRSFYVLGQGGERQRAHYDGMPVDFVASAIQRIGGRARDGFATYNLVNGHDDGVSLDVITDWIAGAGYEITRLADHAQWYGLFKEKMENLPAEKRRISCLSIVGRFASPYPAGGFFIPNGEFVAAVADSPVGPAIPRLDEAYVRKCLDDLRLLGLIGAPPIGAGAAQHGTPERVAARNE